MRDTGTPAVKKSYTTLWVMIVLFALPYVAAMYFYMNRDSFELETSNYGALISPVQQLEDITFSTLNNESFQFSNYSGRWILVTVGNSNCLQACQENMYKIRQIRKAVGQERGRVERVFLLTDGNNISEFTKKLTGYQGMVVAKAYEADSSNFLDTFKYGNTDNHSIENGIFIVDPLGNFMMSYPEGADAEEILKDVRRLLKVSKIG